MMYWLVMFLLTFSVVDSLASIGPLNQHQLNNKYFSKAVVPDSNFIAVFIVTPGDEFDNMLKSQPDAWAESFSVNNLKIGTQVELHVIFSNQLVDKNNSSNVTYDVVIVQPGNIVKKYPGLEGLVGRIPNSSSNSYIARSFLRIKTNESDPIGDWKIYVTIRDNNRQASISGSTTLTFER